jgi:hypothetical protein
MENPIEEPQKITPNAATTNTPSPKTTQPQTYTGFPTQQSPAAGGGTQKNSGGFNIKY